MKPRSRTLHFSFITLFVFVFSLFAPVTAFADDGAPPPDAVPTEVPPPDTTPVDLPAVLEQAPADTQVVVVNESGQAEPLATVNAAEILATGDPVWCPATASPGDAACTGSFGDMASLVAALATDAALPTPVYGGQAGIIWVEDSYAGNDDSQVDLDGLALTTLRNYNLTIQGGWSGGNNTNITGTSSFDVPLNLINWLGNVTMDNLDFVGAGANLQTSGNITVTDSTFTGSPLNGLMTDSLGTTTLTNVTASGNVNGTGIDILSDGDVTLTNVTSGGDSTLPTPVPGNNTGVYIDTTTGTGSVTINGGQFNENDYDGLDVNSAGNIALDNVTVSNNAVDGAYLDTTSGTGNIDVSNSTFDGNDTGLDAYSGGGITVTDSVFSNNPWAGAYLDTAFGTGDVVVSNSTFTANGSYGLIAISGAGNATLTNLTVDGGGITDVGAAVAAINGIVTVNGGTFTNTAGVGLLTVGGALMPLVGVDLVNVTVTLNDGDGAQVYSTFTYACFGDTGILVNVDGGTYTSNTGVPLTVKPGPDGTVTVITAPTFSGNGGGDAMVIDLGNPCEGKEEEKPEEGKPVNIVEVPFKDGAPVAQDCNAYSGTVLVLPDGTRVKFGCPFEGSMTLEGLTRDELPGPLSVGLNFVSAITYGMTDPGGVEVLVNPDGTITLKFKVPEDSHARAYDILYWDTSANNGAGAWVTLPQHKLHQKPVTLNPDSPDDLRMITRGVKQQGDYVTVTVNFTGTFVLVAR